MNPHLIRKFRQRRDILGIIPIVQGTRTIAACTRATTGMYWDSTGTLQTAAINEARWDYDPSTLLLKGLLREKARTNAIRNNTNAGAAVGDIGSGGSMGTYWWIFTALTGLTMSVLGYGTTKNINYVDVRLHGTSSGAGPYYIGFEQNGIIASLQNETWINSVFLQNTAGSTSNITNIKLGIDEYNSVPTFLSGGQSSALTLATSGNLSEARQEFSRTLVNATTAWTVPYIVINITAGGAVDITLRIGMPQDEKGGSTTSKASSPIATSGSAIARSADLISLTGADFTSLWNTTADSFFARVMLANAANGTNQFIARASDNTYNNQVGFSISSTGNAATTTASGGVFDGSAGSVAALSNSTWAMLAGAAASNDLAVSKDGAAVVADASATWPSGLTRLDIGSDHAGANDCETVWIQYLGLLPSRAPNNTLVARAA